ncbi:Tex family protein [Caloranaerobacter azorensis]|uniref:RNA-binding transcriptional accessory protein n=1 Tax=Caloranaerobacter azorensis TaxID=116090 RepID=A0A6P1YHW4_9FIRM|nr:Tex family protein [Caloranaerobacter azorensis]QIB27476.1 RNA-binding transcriptional accessory protein [Caloranaerobacter azorensis]
MDIIKKLIQEFGLKRYQVENTIRLIDEGNTIPFIARYRKEQTGELSDVVLREFSQRLSYLRNLESRKEEVIRLISEQGKLTDELKRKIIEADVLQRVEDLYRPFRPKRRTRATIAKEKGLEPLADIILSQKIEDISLEELAKQFINEEKGVTSIEDAYNGAKDIIAEIISDNAEFRRFIRNITFNKGILISKAVDSKAESVYEMYYDYKEPVKKIPNHRILAINRGEKEKYLRVGIDVPYDEIITYLLDNVITNDRAITTEYLKEAVEDGYKRLIASSIEREIRNNLTERAEEQAIKIFARNLKNLLLVAPVKGKVVMGFDPAFRTGCKIAVVDETGKLLHTTTVYPTEPQNKVEETKNELKEIIDKYDVDIIAIGNGTASRESELIIAEMLNEIDKDVCYTIVSEAGASVYSASEVANEEYPDINVSLRGAISIARRLQDPLAELVKIDPKHVGVGQYQHDINQKKLDEALKGVVEDCVNSVGVDLNTASASLLRYIAGISSSVAKNIVKYREENGKFKNREQLKKVPRLGDKVFVQCAGFLRISDGTNPLDNTSVHPESYDVAIRLIKRLGFSEEDIKNGNLRDIDKSLIDINIESLAQELGVGLPTLKDIINELKKPGRDPRDEMPKPVFRTDVLKIEDLKPDMVLTGTVRNVVDFGAFVDIGVKQDGLVHISQLSNKFVKHPMEIVSVGDIVKVKVIEVDIKKGRIALSMREV